MTVPVPLQREHGRVMENTPWPWASTPRPLQTGQTLGCVPGRAPVPRHVVHAAWVATETGTCAPASACSNDSVTVVSRSLPRSVAGLVRVVRVPAPPPVLKMPDRMSEKEPKSPAPPPPEPDDPPPKGDCAPPKTEPPRSYFLRLSGSPSVS